MRKLLGTIGVTLAVVAVTAVSATPASAQLLPFIEQDNLYRDSAGGANFGMGDGSVRFISYGAVSVQTWRSMGTRTGGEVVSPD